MAGTPSEKPITWDWFRSIWPILIVVVSIVTSYTVLQTQVNYQTAQQCVFDTELKRMQDEMTAYQLHQQEAYSAILTRLAEIQLDLQYVRRDLDRHNENP